jgi:hypothetical protein
VTARKERPYGAAGKQVRDVARHPQVHNKLPALAITPATHSAVLPDIPTIGEFVPGDEASTWNGVGVPRNTSTKIKTRLADLGATVLADLGPIKITLMGCGGCRSDFSLAFRKTDEPTGGVGLQTVHQRHPTVGRRTNMPVQRANYKFDAEDHKVYAAWLRRTLAAYGVLVLIGIAVVTVQATHTTNVVKFMADTVTLSTP